MTTRTRRSRAAVMVTATCILVALNLVVFNLIVRGIDRRWDLTEEQRYRLGAGTGHILERLTDTVTVKCYFSSGLPKRYAHVERLVVEKLQEYERAADGRFAFTFVDPDTDEAARQELEDLGVAPAQVQEFDSVTTPQTVTSWMAMIFRHGDRKKVINLFGAMQPALEDRARLVAELEFHITQGIQAVSTRKRTVAVLADVELVPANPMNPRGDKRKYQGVATLKQLLERSYDVLTLDPDELSRGAELPGGIDVLVVVGPPDLEPAGLYALDQFIVRGGAVLVAADAGSIAEQPRPKTSTFDGQQIQDFDLPTFEGLPRASSVLPFLEHFGVRVEAEFLLDASAFTTVWVADRQFARDPLGRVGVQPVPADGPWYVRMLVPARDEEGRPQAPDQIGEAAAIFPSGETVVFHGASPLTPLEDALARHGARAEVLVSSGPASRARPVKNAVFTPAAADQTEGASPAPSRPLMVAIRGRFTSYYAGRDVPAVRGANGDPLPVTAERLAARVENGAEDGALLVVGDADFFTDAMLRTVQLTELQINGVTSRELAQKKPVAMLRLAHNAVDLLAYGEEARDLFEIKNRLIGRSRDVRKLDDDEKVRIDLVVFGLVPGLVLLFGLGRWTVRRLSNRATRSEATP